MRRSIRRLVAVVASGAMAGLGLSVAAAPAQAATDIKVGALAINSSGALQYAIDSGIFRKNGLNVTEVVIFPAPPPGIAGLASGAVQFTYTPTIPAINAYENGGVDLRIVAPADGYTRAQLAAAKKDPKVAALLDDTGVCASPSAGINRWRDLEGKTVAVPARGAQAEVTIVAAVKNDGGDATKIKWTTLPPGQAIDAVKSGRIDAGFTVEPFVTECISQGLKNVGRPGVEFFDTESAIGVWVTTAPYAKANPKVVSAFQKSMFEAHQYAMKSKANMNRVLRASTKITEVSPEVALAANPPIYPLYVTRVDVTRPAQKMLDLGFLSKKADVAGLLQKQYRPRQ
ncbi:MAG: ABC transporter substrate-binding protein [Actinomycetota bacterium]|nr:ABC transporter substrate-binding protein [Actinomycetota bacterium]